MGDDSRAGVTGLPIACASPSPGLPEGISGRGSGVPVAASFNTSREAACSLTQSICSENNLR